MKIRRYIDCLTISYTSIYHDEVENQVNLNRQYVSRELTVDPLAFL